MNPYQVLGVNPSATAEDIKLAWRRLSKIHHPDRKGGSPERQAELNMAYNLLMDSAAREQFDLSGETQEVPPLDVRARQLLMQFLLAAIGNRLEHDPIRHIRTLIKQNTQTFQVKVREHNQELTRVTKLKKKIKFKGSGESSLGGVFQNILDHHAEQLTKIAADLDALNRAAAMLDELVEADKALPNVAPQDGLLNLLNQIR